MATGEEKPGADGGAEAAGAGLLQGILVARPVDGV